MVKLSNEMRMCRGVFKASWIFSVSSADCIVSTQRFKDFLRIIQYTKKTELVIKYTVMNVNLKFAISKHNT